MTTEKPTTLLYIYVVHAAFWDGSSYSSTIPAIIGVFAHADEAYEAKDKAWEEWDEITSYNSQEPKVTRIEVGRYNDEWTVDY